MDRINFLGKDSFPLSSDTLEFMQEMILKCCEATLIGGSSYILSGCEEDAYGTVSKGVVVLNGEPYPFAGGQKENYVTIKEEYFDDHAFGESYPEVYTTRTAIFSNSMGGTKWADLSRVVTNKELNERLNAIDADPVGVIKEWAGPVGSDNLPKGYKLCNGEELSKEDFKELYDVIGTSYGGSEKMFNLPNAEGRFSLGYKKDIYNMGSTAGEAAVTLTESQMPSHNHTKGNIFNKLSARAADVRTGDGSPTGSDANASDVEYRVSTMDSGMWEEATIKETGGNKSHNNMPPYIVFAKIIKVK